MLRVYVVMGRPAMMAEIVAHFPPATVISVQAQLKILYFKYCFSSKQPFITWKTVETVLLLSI